MRIADRQSGVVSREQLRTAGVTAKYVEHQVRARRWTDCSRTVVLLQNAPPTRRQLMWIALSDAGPDAALASHTSLELHGFTSFAKEAESIHLVVPRGAKVARLPGVVVHESRRSDRMPRVRVQHLMVIGAAVSVIDAAAWQPYPRFAATLLAASVQQRLVTVADLDEGLAIVGRVRHKQWMRLALRDIAMGAESLGEIDLARLCRQFRLRPPKRQAIRTSSDGRARYLDSEWDTPRGAVVLEIDGAHHFSVEHWQADMRRERQIVIQGGQILRATALEIRADPAAVARDLIAAGVPQIEPSCQNLNAHFRRDGF